jgi:anti-sigma factor RsiW
MRFFFGKPKPDALSCQELVELVTDYLEGRLPESDLARFDAHIEACDHCVTYLEQIRSTITISGTLTEKTLPPGAADALLAEFRNWKLGRG